MVSAVRRNAGLCGVPGPVPARAESARHMSRRSGGDHRAERPQWTCEMDGEPWPCELARKALAEAYQADQQALSLLMAWLLEQATTDLALAEPARLYGRFLRWTLAPGQLCRVCGSRGHDMLAGVPPRLIPCNSRRQAVDDGEA
jgi:hypothetical protein